MKLPKPTNAFIGASWAALIIGALVYLIGLWNSDVGLGEKGYYVVLIFFGLFAVLSLQKTVRDTQEELPVSDLYYGICWVAILLSLLLMLVGLWNATFTLAEKGFYGMAYTLSLFGAAAVQKNTRDTQMINKLEGNKGSAGKSWFSPDVFRGAAETNENIE